MKVFFRLLNYARPFRHYLPEYILWVIPSIIFGAMNFALLIPLLDVLFKTQELTVQTTLPDFQLSADYLNALFNYFFAEIAQSRGKIAALEFICLTILISVFLANFFRWFAQRVLIRMRTWVVFRLRKAYFEQMTRLDLSFFHHQKKGNLLSIMSTDVQEVESSVVSSMQILFRDPLQVIAYVGLLFIISVKLTVLTLVFFPISVLAIARISKKLRQAANQTQSLLGKILNVTEETLSGIRIIKAFSAERFMQKKFNQENDTYRRVSKSMNNRRELASPLSEFLGVATVIVVLIFGGIMVLNNQSNLTAAQFITYIALYSQIIPPIKNISTAVSTIQRGLVAGERVLKIIDVPVEITEKPEATELAQFSQKIEYQNVSFSYRKDAPTLKNISITLEHGKMVALVGKSGSGKSTTADLLCRFYDVQEGAIFVDNQDIRDVTVESLRAQLGIVTQEPILFHDTVFNNIAFGMENVDEEEVVKAAKIANAHEFIVQMEEGYQTVIGDRGSKLSGGQRQRLSIARAVLKNPSILILDEATSSLDTESERLVQESIQNLMKNRTTLVIAHRLSTIQHADEIIVMEEGEIVERGSHEQLFHQNGIYRKLCDMQSVV